MPPTLPPMPVAGRADSVRAALDGAGCEALLVSKLVNIRWLTGFSGSAGYLVVLPDELVLVTDGRYREQAAEQLGAAGVEARVEITPTLAAQRDVLADAVRPLERLGLEADVVTWSEQRAFAEAFAPTLVPTEQVVDRLREIKDDAEVVRITEAARIADAALADVRALLGEEPTEQAFAAALDHRIRELGAEGTAFDTIVASGPNAAKPHHRPSARRIVEGDLVVIDFGARVDGYCSDMTRTIAVGEPDATGRRLLDVVTAAQAAGVRAVAAGVGVRDVDAACRSVIAEAGWADAFVHPTGHGLGLEIHEQPRLATTSDAVLRPGHVVTVEPGVYLPGAGGVRVEDTVLVTEAGCHPLTHTPKDPSLCLPSRPTT